MILESYFYLVEIAQCVVQNGLLTLRECICTIWSLLWRSCARISQHLLRGWRLARVLHNGPSKTVMRGETIRICVPRTQQGTWRGCQLIQASTCVRARGKNTVWSMESRWNTRSNRLLKRNRTCMVLMRRLLLFMDLGLSQLSIPFMLALDHGIEIGIEMSLFLLEITKFGATILAIAINIQGGSYRRSLHSLTNARQGITGPLLWRIRRCLRLMVLQHWRCVLLMLGTSCGMICLARRSLCQSSKGR